MKYFKITFAVLILSILFCFTNYAQEEIDAQNILNDLIKEKTKFGQTYDLYDADKNKVRHLKFNKILNISEANNIYSSAVEFIDKTSRELVETSIIYQEIDESFKIISTSITNVTEPVVEISKDDEIISKPVISPSEETVKQIAGILLKKRAQSSGTIDLFDMENKTVRNLEFVSFKDGMEKKDSNYIIEADCKDVKNSDTTDMIGIKIILKNINARLKIESISLL